MTPRQLISHYDTIAKAAKALKISPARISMWKSKGYVPARMQAAIAGLSDGALKIGAPFEARKKNV